MASNFLRPLKAESFFLDIHDFRDLIRSEWPIFGPRLWVTYRLLSALYLVAVLVWALVVKFAKYQWKFFTFLTHWAYVALVINYLLKLAASLKYFKWLNFENEPNEKSPLIKSRPLWILNKPDVKVPILLQISWFFNNITIGFAFFVSLGYWPSYLSGRSVPVSDVLAIQLHGVNAILALIDFLLCAMPTFFLHIYQPLLFLATYEAFTAFYYLAGGTDKNGLPYIYNVLDWRKPLETVVVNLLYWGAQLLVISIIVWLVAVLRQILGFCARKSKKDIPDETV